MENSLLTDILTSETALCRLFEGYLSWGEFRSLRRFHARQTANCLDLGPTLLRVSTSISRSGSFSTLLASQSFSLKIFPHDHTVACLVLLTLVPTVS